MNIPPSQKTPTTPQRVLIKLGGSFLQNATSCGHVFADLKTLIQKDIPKNIPKNIQAHTRERAYRQPIQLIIVHGGGEQLGTFAHTQGTDTRFDTEGNRVTDTDMMSYADMILGGAVNARILRSALSQGMSAVGINAASGGTISATHLTSDDATPNFSASVKTCNTKLLTCLIQNGFIPIISSVAATQEGAPCNINADDVAMSIASEWKAEYVLLLSDVEGVYDASLTLMPAIFMHELPSILTQEHIRDGMKKKLTSIYTALCASPSMRVIIGTHKGTGDMRRLLQSERGTSIRASYT